MTENQLLENNMGLVQSIVKRMNPPNPSEYDEYLQAGRIGLMKAIRDLDLSRGKLTTLAWYSIRRSILAHIFKCRKHTYKSLTKDVAYYNPVSLWEILPSSLTDHERKIVQMRSEGYTFSEISSSLKTINRITASKIYKTALNKIRMANAET